MLKRTFLATLLAALSLASIGCGSAEEEEFTYGEADMRGVAVGDFKGTLTMNGKVETTLDLTLTQAPPDKQPTCESRTFGIEPLCMGSTSLRLTGTLTTADGAHAATALDGDFSVYGYTFTNGELSLGGTGVTLHATWNGKGFENGSVNVSEQQGTFTLEKK